LSPYALVALDDTHRLDERAILDRWGLTARETITQGVHAHLTYGVLER
jgi:hypothetical protein